MEIYEKMKTFIESLDLYKLNTIANGTEYYMEDPHISMKESLYVGYLVALYPSISGCVISIWCPSIDKQKILLNRTDI